MFLFKVLFGISRGLCFGLGISKRSNTILCIMQGLRFLLPGISRGYSKKIKNSRGSFKKIYPQPPVWIFSGIAHYKKGKSKHFWENMGPVLGRLKTSTFYKKRMTTHSEFSQGTVKLLLRLLSIFFFFFFFINLGLDLGKDMKKELDMSLEKVLEMFTI